MQSDESLSFGAQNKGVLRSFGLILLQRLKEGVTDGLLKGDPFRRVVLHHLLNQVKQLLVVSSLGGHVVLKRFTMLPHISATGAMLIPV